MHDHERLSALMDDAGDASDRQLLLNAANSRELRETWSRYHVIGNILRDREAAPFDTSLVDRIAAVIVQEPQYQGNVVELPAKPPAKSLMSRPAARLALAASIAAIALGGIFTTNELPIKPFAIAASNPVRAVLPSVEKAQIPVLKNGEYQRRLNAYLVNFNEQRAQLRAPGVHPYVRIVDFETGTAP